MLSVFARRLASRRIASAACILCDKLVEGSGSTVLLSTPSDTISKSLENFQQFALYAKAAKNKKDSDKNSKATITPGTADFDLSAAKSEMQKAVERFHEQLADIRTGRASPGMLDHLKVDVYGESTQLRSVATVTVRDAQTLAASAFDTSTLPSIEKSIRDSALQLNPSRHGDEILVKVPRPTQEMVKALLKIVGQEAEAARERVRYARREAMKQAKQLAGKDDQKRAEKEVQKLTDTFIADIDKVEASKEKDMGGV